MFRRKPAPQPSPLANALSQNYWLPFQILAMSFGLTQGQWEQVKPELERVAATGHPVADFVFACRIAGVKITAPADWGMEPWDARSDRDDRAREGVETDG